MPTYKVHKTTRSGARPQRRAPPGHRNRSRAIRKGIFRFVATTLFAGNVRGFARNARVLYSGVAPADMLPGDAAAWDPASTTLDHTEHALMQKAYYAASHYGEFDTGVPVGVQEWTESYYQTYQAAAQPMDALNRNAFYPPVAHGDLSIFGGNPLGDIIAKQFLGGITGVPLP